MSDNPFSQLDAYERRHLATHLRCAGRAQTLHLLLAYETNARRNAWYELKESWGETTDYLADLLVAWQLADEVFTADVATYVRQSINQQCLYALVNSSLRSIAGDIPAVMLAALVKQGVWAPEQALAYARQVVVPAHRAAALAELTAYFHGKLHEAVLREALETALAVNLRIYPKALAAIVPLVTEAIVRETLASEPDAEVLAQFVPRLAMLGYGAEALAEARVISGLGRAQALADVAVLLPEPQRYQVLHEAHETALRREAAINRFEALERVAACFAQSGYVDDALAVAREITWTLQHERVLAILVQPLAEQGRVDEARSIADHLTFWHLYAEARIQLAPFVPNSERTRLLGEALEAARHNENDPWRPARVRALGTIAAQLEEPLRGQLLQEALAAALAMSDEYDRAEALNGLAPLLPGELLRQALTRQGIHDEHDRGRSLGVLARRLRGAQKNQVLEAALAITRQIQNTRDRIRVLTEMAQYLRGSRRKHVLRELLTAVPLLKTPAAQEESLRSLVELLPTTLLHDAFNIAREIQDEARRGVALAALAPRLTQPLLHEALAAAWQIEDNDALGRLLAGLAPFLSPPLLQEALDLAHRIANRTQQIEVLAGLVPYLNAQQALGVWDEIAALIHGRQGSRILVALVVRLAELGQTEVALQLLPLIRSPENRIQALVGMARHLEDPHDVIAEAATNVGTIGSAQARAQALEQIAAAAPALLRTHYLNMALSAAEAIEDHRQRSDALATLVSRLTETGLYAEAFAATRRIPDELDRVKVLVQIAPRLSKPLHGQIWRESLAVARSISGGLGRARAMAEVALHAPQPFRRQALAELDLAMLFREYMSMVESLAPYLPEPMLLETTKLVLGWENMPVRKDALEALAPGLSRLPRVTLVDFWPKVLRHLSSRGRSDILSDLGALAPLIAALGSDAVLVDVSHVIQDVGRWWP